MLKLYLNTSSSRSSVTAFDKAANNIIEQEGLTGQPVSRVIDPDISNGISFLLDGTGEGDTVIVKNIFCLGRDPEEAFETYIDLFEKTSALIFTESDYFSSPNFFPLLKEYKTKAGVAKALEPAIVSLINREFIIREKRRRKIQRGISFAAKEGRVPGRRKGSSVSSKKFGVAKEIILRESNTFGGPLSDPELIERLGISRNTFYRYKNLLKKGVNPLSGVDHTVSE